MGQSQTIQPTDNRWMISKQPKAVTLVEAKKRKKSMKMGDIASAKKMTQMTFQRVFTFKKKVHTA